MSRDFNTELFSQNPSSSTSDSGDFECNICFDLAQDPIVTLCGHLFCWPCLFRWLHHHSQSQECPVCKALIQEDKLVPLYGRGKTNADPRSKSYPEMEIPHRPSGQRPEPVPLPRTEPNNFFNYGSGMNRGFIPTATARFGNFTMGLIPSFFNIHYHAFSDANFYGTTSWFPHGGFSGLHGANVRMVRPHVNRGQNADAVLKNLFIFIGVCVTIALIRW